MDNKTTKQAKVLFHFCKSDHIAATPSEKKWHISENAKLGIPLSECHTESTVPALNDADPDVYSLLALMLSESGLWTSWYILASKSLVRCGSSLTWDFARRLYSVGKPIYRNGKESVAVIIVWEGPTAPYTVS